MAADGGTPSRYVHEAWGSSQLPFREGDRQLTQSEFPPLPPEKGTWDEKAVDRRRFLSRAFGALGGLGGLLVGIPGLRFLAGNSLQPTDPKWVELGAVVDLDAGPVHRVNYSTTAIDAWREVTKRGTVYVYSTDEGASYVALDGTCTHLGCIVRWKESDERFSCPCHSASFSREGEVLSGPPPKPLRELPVKIDNGVLFAEI